MKRKVGTVRPSKGDVSEEDDPVIDGDGSSWLDFEGDGLHVGDEGRYRGQIVAYCSGESSPAGSVPVRMLLFPDGLIDIRYDRWISWLSMSDSRPVLCPLHGGSEPIT